MAQSFFNKKFAALASKCLVGWACVHTPQAEATVYQGLYIDMGVLYGSYYEGNWSTYFGTNSSGQTYMIQSALDTSLATLYSNCQTVGITNILLSFGQLSGINGYYAGTGVPSTVNSTDVIGYIINDNYFVSPDGDTVVSPNLVAYMVQKAHSLTVPLNVTVSLGGANANNDDVNILSLKSGGAHDSGAGQAMKLVSWLESYDFDGLDCDIEGDYAGGGEYLLFPHNGESVVLNFFNTLHNELSKRNIPMTATFLGNLTTGPQQQLAPLAQNFTQLFDGVNLMLYGGAGGNYYIDWDNNDVSPPVNWGLNQWLEYTKNPATLAIGFYTSIDYTNPASSGGYQNYPVTGLTEGAAAATILETAIGSTVTPNPMNLTVNQVGQPFWWLDNPANMFNLSSSDATALLDFYNQLNP